MDQPSLFAPAGNHPEVLVDDASGRVAHLPAAATAEQAARWFAALHAGIPWASTQRRMYERVVQVPRLTAQFAVADRALPPALGEALALVRRHFGTPFDSIGLNLYRDEHDAVAPHNDRLDELVRGHPIVLLSLGATRRMVIRGKRPPRRVLELQLAAGSLLEMSWTSQLHYDHGIPRERVACGPRISLAFRVRGPGANPGAG